VDKRKQCYDLFLKQTGNVMKQITFQTIINILFELLIIDVQNDRNQFVIKLLQTDKKNIKDSECYKKYCDFLIK